MQNIKILLSCNINSKNYADVIKQLGAEATSSYLPTVDTSYDGLILCGGNDINPERYSEALNGAINIDHKRDDAELLLLEDYVKAGKPIFGICRGCQLINVFFGGSLYQHLPEADLHQKKNNADSVHSVKAISNSIVFNLYGEDFAVNSSHHQAIKTLGVGLSASALWNNKYVEAIEHSTYPIFGVQWHPERMCEREDTVCGTDIFKYFLNMCQTYKKNK